MKIHFLPYRISTFIGFLISTQFVYGQIPGGEPTDKQEQIIEDFMERTNEEYEFETYFEYLSILKENPLDINTADYDQISSLALLTDQQVTALIQYRKIHGPLASMFELKGVPYFDIETVYSMLPYVTVQSEIKKIKPFKINNALKYGKHQFLLRTHFLIENAKGYIPDTANPTATRYLGDKYRLYARYHYAYSNRLSFGITAEKDPGEEFFTGTQKQGFDFYSAHLFMTNLGKVKQLAIGDYELKLGQGLVIWSGFGIRKGPAVMNIKRNTYPLKRNTAVNENRFMRGLATTLDFGKIELTLFSSSKKVDGNLNALDTLSEEAILASSLQENGLHRTLSEISDKQAINEKIAGGHLKYRSRNFDIGFTGLYMNFNPGLELNTKPYSHFRLNGRELINFSTDYTWIYNNFLFFGETAISGNGSWATINGLVYNLDYRTGISLLYRNFQKDYQAIYANAFAESSTVENESGLYAGLSFSINRSLKLEAYADIFKHPWLKYKVDGPGNGVEVLGQLNYIPNRATSAYIRVKHESKTINLDVEDEKIERLGKSYKTNIRVHLQHNTGIRVSLRSRVETVLYKESNTGLEAGYLIYQDLIYNLSRIPLKLAFRIAYFNTSSFDTRVYTYERDVLYQYSVPFYNGKGIRYYLVANYKINRILQVWLKIGRYQYPFNQTIGNGLEEIDGNSKTEIKIQLRLRF